VPRVSPRVRRLARDMLETMYAASGVGLAAPQAGVQQRVIVVDVGENLITRIEDPTRLWRISELSATAEKGIVRI